MIQPSLVRIDACKPAELIGQLMGCGPFPPTHECNAHIRWIYNAVSATFLRDLDLSSHPGHTRSLFAHVELLSPSWRDHEQNQMRLSQRGLDLFGESGSGRNGTLVEENPTRPQTRFQQAMQFPGVLERWISPIADEYPSPKITLLRHCVSFKRIDPRSSRVAASLCHPVSQRLLG